MPGVGGAEGGLHGVGQLCDLSGVDEVPDQQAPVVRETGAEGCRVQLLRGDLGGGLRRVEAVLVAGWPVFAALTV